MMGLNSPPEQSYEESLLIPRWLWSTVVGLLLIFGGIWLIWARTSVSNLLTQAEIYTLEPAPIAGHPAPDFELKNLAGKSIRLSDFKGKPVILNFWATWCGPCRAEFPELQQVAIENGDNLVIIGVNHTSADTPALVPDFVEEFGITFPIVLDETGDVVKTYQVLGLPTSVFIDRNGIIQELFTGPVTKTYIESKLSEL
jgi:thiol-disulfide isomerase/thioredoxin